jgi:hypothetical protein
LLPVTPKSPNLEAVNPPDAPPLACNLNAIPPEDQHRYKDLVSRLRAGIRDRTELPFGYAYRLDLTSISLPELGDWITLERLCCAFLSFRIEVDADGSARLTVLGPKGVKAVLQEEF